MNTVVDDELGAWLPGTWVPAPRYLMRRARVMAAFDDVTPGRLLEVGCGAGAMLHDLVRRGWQARGVEQSAAARAVATALHADTGVEIVDRVVDGDGPFDALLSCEVLEHIDDDVGALRSWVSCVRPGGHVVLSVPAHPILWGPSDVWAGHVRRYTKAAFLALAEAANLEVKHIECYGFPVANATFVARTALTVLKRERPMSAAASTARSGVDRSLEVRLFPAQQSLPGRLALRAALVAQKQSLQTPLGDGYLLVATRR